jgi:hypothetical protein
MRVYATSHDPVLTVLYSETQAVDLFGESDFREWSIEMPDELATRYFESKKAFFASQDELRKFLKLDELGFPPRDEKPH